MKYIVTKRIAIDKEDGPEEMFIFPRDVYHKDMAEAVGHLKDHSGPGGWRRICREPISAGFIESGQCTGNSESLGLKSRPQDNDLLPWRPSV